MHPMDMIELPDAKLRQTAQAGWRHTCPGLAALFLFFHSQAGFIERIFLFPAAGFYGLILIAWSCRSELHC